MSKATAFVNFTIYHLIMNFVFEEYANEAIDHGDVMECLYNHKDAEEMNEICRSYVDHFELISLRDYRFSYHFNQSCAEDIRQYCRDEALSSDKSVL